MTAPERWLAVFAQQDAAKVAQQDAERKRIALKIQSESLVVAGVVQPIQVLEPGREIVSGFDEIRRLGAANGWALRVVESLIAHPSKGIVQVQTLRAARHDERVFAAWWSGTFDCGWYFGPTGLERLGGGTGKATPTGLVPIVALTVDRMLDVAKDAGLKIPSKERKRDQVIAALLKAGIVVAAPPKTVRGVADALAGLSLTRH